MHNHDQQAFRTFVVAREGALLLGASLLRTVRHRPRVMTAVAGSAAVLCAALPLSFVVGGSSRGPSTPAAIPAVSRPATGGPVYVTNADGLQVASPPAAPAAPSLPLPHGRVFAGQVVLVDGKQLSVQDDGVTYRLPAHGQAGEEPVGTPYGVLLPGPHGIDLVDKQHHLVALTDTSGGYECGVLPSPDGRYVAWGERRGTGGSLNGEPTLKGVYVLYDLRSRRVAYATWAQAQGCPAAFTTDGRVVMTLGDGGVSGAALWTPSTGAVHAVGRAPVTVWTSRLHHERVVVRMVDGYCSYYRPGVTRATASLAGCGADLGSPTSRTGRLEAALSAAQVRLDDQTLLDAEHVGVLASSRRTVDDGAFTFTYRWLLTCAVPPTGSVSCVQNQQLEPVRAENSGPENGVGVGVLPFLVH